MSDYVVKDIALADFGRKELDIAETEMPGLVLRAPCRFMQIHLAQVRSAKSRSKRLCQTVWT